MTDKFIGYLVSVECKNVFYQGIVASIDSTKAIIQLKNCFQNGIHCGAKLIEIKTKEIENIEILADPQNALTFLNPKLVNDVTNGNSSSSNENNEPKLQISNKVNSSTSENNNNNNNLRVMTKTQQQPLKVNSSKNNVSPMSGSPPTTTINNNHYQYNENNHSKRKQSYNGNGYTNGTSHDSYHQNIENCFTSVNVETIKEDFDFEQNLALFDKDAFYEEMEGHSKPTNSNYSEEPLNAYDSLIKQLNSNGNSSHQYLNGNDMNKSAQFPSQRSTTERYHQISVANLFSSSTSTIVKPPITPSNNNSSLPVLPSYQTNSTKNYRYDEMVLDTGEPMDLQQIQIPLMSTNTSKRYVTDDGVILPCIDYELRKRLFDQSYKHGFSKERQVECMGRCCAEMALQLVGGPLRFSPKNNHQKPSILVLANSQDLQGAYALCSARLLSNRSCKIYLYITKSSSTNNNETNSNNEYFETELKLFRSIDLPANTYLNSVDDIKNLNSIDLIINGLDSSSQPPLNSVWYKNLVRYIDHCKASVLSIDPCIEGSSMSSKWCLVPVLPLEMSPKCGRVYLCDLGFTKNMFQSVNIKYRSPFGAKFLIPLHDD